ncbi:MAG TPA: UDP-3-O-acyl-N-acetylglucosamine deacetylase [Candidatus Nanoarchaeia archaeon]|nr:UDP-3-O-acyl-N-acetylglucosamine deacetylase [Candidatus Nanoarchaeia archaeon]
MNYQKTLKDNIFLKGREVYGGNNVDVLISPASTDRGLFFRTLDGECDASILHAKASKSSVLLKDGKVGIIGVEHLLAPFYAYDISNAEIYVKRNKSKSYAFLEKIGLASKLQVVPSFRGVLEEVCEAIEKIGVKDKEKSRETYKLKKKISLSPRLVFEPIDGENLIMDITTEYPVIGKQEKEITITPSTFKEISSARNYARFFDGEVEYDVFEWKHLTQGLARLIKSDRARGFLAKFLCYPQFGIGHGFTRDNLFISPGTKGKWLEQERMPAEIAGHSVIDGLGVISLLSKKLVGAKVTCRFGSHKDYINTVKEIEKLIRQEV